jgi:hypothetical protein
LRRALALRASRVHWAAVIPNEARMLSITPVRERISERFPVASFVVSVPPDRYFEIACATDPKLFHAEHKPRRTPANFATSRIGGLLRAPAGQATYLIPPQQLRRFAGAQRLYYALATFRGARNEDPILTVSGDRLDHTPSIRIAPDFTGRSLDRGKIGAADARYGGEAGVLGWGGDDVLVARAPAQPRRIGSGAASAEPFVYDDGFDASLWEAKQDEDEEEDEDSGGEAYGGRARRGSRRGSGEPPGYEDAAELVLCGVEPPGYEDAAALPRDFALGSPQSYGQASYAQPSYGQPYGQPSYAQVAAPPMPPPMPPPAPAPAMQQARYGGRAPHHERYGSATGAANGAYVEPPPQQAFGGDIDGYEDVPDLVRNLGAHNRPFFGNGAAAVPAPVAPISDLEPAAPARLEYSDDLAIADPLPDVAAAGPEPFAPADPMHRLRVIDRVALAESGSERYRKVAADPTAGLLWGYCQLRQRQGALGHGLAVCHRRDRAAFVRAFGEHNAAPPGDGVDLAALAPGNLLKITCAAGEDARMAPVTPPSGGAPVALWQAPWLDAFRAAGDVQAFQEAQREVADRRFYLPYIDFLRWLGIDSVRGHAIFVDRALQMGGAGAARWVARTAGPVRGQDDLRRALAHLGHADLRSFQAAPPAGVTLPAPDGVFGALSHAAIAGALRTRGDSPLPLLSEEQLLDALVAEADSKAAASPAWRDAARRMHALRDDPALASLPAEPQRMAA